jgi:hypothetical protein
MARKSESETSSEEQTSPEAAFDLRHLIVEPLAERTTHLIRTVAALER